MKTADLIQSKKLEVVRVIREGPRFFIAVVNHGRQKYFFKSLYIPDEEYIPSKRDNFNLSREVLFLSWFTTDGDVKTPKVVDYELSNNSWYLREFIPGTVQAHKGSNFLFKRSFFNERSLAFADFLYRLQEESDNMPEQLHEYTKRDTSKESKENLLPMIAYFQKHHTNILGDDLYSKIAELYLHERPFYLAEQNALSHMEPYAANIVRHYKGHYYLTDWENIFQRDIACDIAIMWSRGFDQPAWQAQLLKRFVSYYNNDRFWRLFNYHVVTQQMHNIDYFIYKATKHEQRRKPAFLRFAKVAIAKAVNQEFFL